MLMILARLVRSESFWAVVKVRSPHNGPEVSYPRAAPSKLGPLLTDSSLRSSRQTRSALRARSTPNTAAAVTTAILGGAERASGADGQPGATSQRQAHERQDAHERPGPAHVIGRATVS